MKSAQDPRECGRTRGVSRVVALVGPALAEAPLDDVFSQREYRLPLRDI